MNRSRSHENQGRLRDPWPGKVAGRKAGALKKQSLGGANFSLGLRWTTTPKFAIRMRSDISDFILKDDSIDAIDI